MKNNQTEICSQEQCTGCAACASICAKGAIEMEWNQEGFLYPKINNDKCVNCGLCSKICPVVSPVNKNEEGTCYAAWSNNTFIRSHSSSGGVFSELAIAVFSENGCVVGAALDADSGIVSHKIIENESQLELLRGSKYVQSVITPELFREVKNRLRNNQIVLFTGCPCQIAAIRAIAKDSEFLYTVDLVCHGVPSPLYFSNVFLSIRNRIKKLVRFNFRELDGWYVSANVDVEKNGRLLNLPLYGEETHYIDAFLKGLLHRNNCYSCKYSSVKRVGDITIADFWGIGTLKPITPLHQKGCSLVLVNTPKGDKLFSKLCDRLYIEQRDVQETITAGNEQLYQSSKMPAGRKTFYMDAKTLTPKQLINKYNLKIRIEPTFWYRLTNFFGRYIK